MCRRGVVAFFRTLSLSSTKRHAIKAASSMDNHREHPRRQEREAAEEGEWQRHPSAAQGREDGYDLDSRHARHAPKHSRPPRSLNADHGESSYRTQGYERREYDRWHEGAHGGHSSYGVQGHGWQGNGEQGYDRERYNGPDGFYRGDHQGDHIQRAHEEDYYNSGHQDDYYGTSYQEDHYQGDHQGEPSRQSAPPPSQLRLVKLASDVLPEGQSVAIIDGRSEGVSIGRDRSFSARIRCPSMEVSKHHANIFRLAKDERGRKSQNIVFAVADTGSTHGTFLLLDPPPRLTSESMPPLTAYQRLSPPKKASVPTSLRHLSLLRVGQTVFQAHLHTGWTTSCQDCALSEDGTNEIVLLVPDKKESKANTAAKDVAEPLPPVAPKVAPWQAIRELKSRHLNETIAEQPVEADTSQYVDRAAARRARGGVQAAPPAAPAATPPTSNAPTRASATSSEPAAKLDASNRGYQMFASMSCKSGEAGLAKQDPILARGVEGRAGLGSKRLLDVQEMAARSQPSGPNDFRERQRRRFEEAK